MKSMDKLEGAGVEPPPLPVVTGREAGSAEHRVQQLRNVATTAGGKVVNNKTAPSSSSLSSSVSC